MAKRQTEIAPAKKRGNAAGRKLKVFEATMGFYDTVVAAPSQTAALRAWGTSQNLFKDGVARASRDGRATEAALAQPGIVLRRPIGTKKPFGLDAGRPEIPDLPSVGKKAPRSAVKEPLEREPDRSALDRAEAAMSRLEEERRTERDEFEERRRVLDAEETRAEERFEDAHTGSAERLERERKAYRDDGGRLK